MSHQSWTSNKHGGTSFATTPPLAVLQYNMTAHQLKCEQNSTEMMNELLSSWQLQ